VVYVLEWTISGVWCAVGFICDSEIFEYGFALTMIAVFICDGRSVRLGGCMRLVCLVGWVFELRSRFCWIWLCIVGFLVAGSVCHRTVGGTRFGRAGLV